MYIVFVKIFVICVWEMLNIIVKMKKLVYVL